jgi:hypothetical protein
VKKGREETGSDCARNDGRINEELRTVLTKLIVRATALLGRVTSARVSAAFVFPRSVEVAEVGRQSVEGKGGVDTVAEAAVASDDCGGNSEREGRGKSEEGGQFRKKRGKKRRTHCRWRW